MIIYLITNTVNGKYYVGQTVHKTVEARHGKNFKYSYDVSNYFCRALLKYGVDVFKSEVLCECPDLEALNEAEVFFIWFLGSHKSSFGYNSTKGGRKWKFNEATLKYLSSKRKAICALATTEEKAEMTAPGRTKLKELREQGGEWREEYNKKLSVARKKRWEKLSPAERKEFLKAAHAAPRIFSEESRRAIGLKSKNSWTPKRREEQVETLRVKNLVGDSNAIQLTYKWRDGSEHTGIFLSESGKWVKIVNSVSKTVDWILPENIHTNHSSNLAIMGVVTSS